MLSDEYINQIKNEKIAVLMGGDSQEAIISRKSAQAIYTHLKKLHLNAHKLEASKDVINTIKAQGFSLVYNALHGQNGEDGIIQANLDFNGIAYTGEGYLTSAICFNKIKTKNIFDANFIKTPKYHSFKSDTNLNNVIEALDIKNIHFPVMLKPISSGSSIGIKIIKNENTLLSSLREFKSQNKLLDFYLEEKINGREITVGICTYENELKILPIVELKPKKEFYDYEAKYTLGMTDMVIPANLPKSLKVKVEKITEKLFNLFKCQECIRVDFMVDGIGIPHVLEINTSPGMTETSDIPKMLETSGILVEHYIAWNLYRAKKNKKAS